VTQQIANQLGASRVILHDCISPNPELEDLDSAVEYLRNERPTAVVALGGGSVMDAAKVLAVAVPCNRINPLANFFRRGLDATWGAGLPVVAIPTTSGTGAEVTPFATVWDRSTRKKHSLAGHFMYPTHALLDVELTVSLSREDTLYPGLDAISHALESLWNKHSTPVSTAMSLEALSIAVEALPQALERPFDMFARERMQQASLLSGLAISQTRTAIAHSISYPLTSYFGVPHGLACSFTLPELLRLNLPMLVAKSPHQRTLFAALTDLFKGLNLHERINSYVSAEQVHALTQHMVNKDRMGNFSGTIGLGLDTLLANSLVQS